jgi:outer membrane protein TolC
LVADTPDFRQVAAQERISEAGRAIARSSFFPTFDLTGSVGRRGDSWFPEVSRWNVGLTLSIPLLNGGSDYFSAKSASATLASAIWNRRDIERQIRVKIKQSFNGYVEAIERWKVDNESLEAASVRAEIARSKYNNGLLSFDAWDIIENELISRQKTALVSQRDRIIAEAAWEQTQGKGVIR